MRRIFIAALLLSSLAFGQGGTTSGNIKPSNTGQDIGDAGHRWDIFARDLNVSGTFTINGTFIGNFAGNVTGNLTGDVTGNVTSLGASTFAKANNVIWVGSATYPTLESGITAALAVGNGGTVIMPPGFTETFSTAISIGDSTHNVRVLAYPPVTLNCAVVDANPAAPTTDCVTLNRDSDFRCVSSGIISSASALNTSCQLVATSAAKFRNLFVVPYVSGGSRFWVDGWVFSNVNNATYGNPNGSGALVYLYRAQQPAAFQNVHILYPKNGYGLVSEGGTVHISNVQVDGESDTGAKPCLFTSPTTGAYAWNEDQRVYDTTCEHAGLGQYNWDINGNGVLNGVSNFRCFGCRIEAQLSGSGDTTALTRIRDAKGVTFYSPFLGYPGGGGTGYGFELSESVAGYTDNFHIYGAQTPASVNKLVSNTIITDTMLKDGGDYHYSTSAYERYDDTARTKFGNGAYWHFTPDATNLTKIRCGSTALEACGFQWISGANPNTAQWDLKVLTDNALQIFDNINAYSRFSMGTGTGGVTFFRFAPSGSMSIASSGNTTLVTIDNNGLFSPTKYGSQTNCSSSGGTCVAAPAGSVSIAAAATTVTVASTAVTANSQIFVQEDSSLGTKLGVTCNTTISRTYAVTTRTAATSFVITTSAAPAVNPACLSYFVVN